MSHEKESCNHSKDNNSSNDDESSRGSTFFFSHQVVLFFSFDQLLLGIVYNLFLAILVRWYDSSILSLRLLLIVVAVSLYNNFNIWREFCFTISNYDSIWWSSYSICRDVGTTWTAWWSRSWISCVCLSNGLGSCSCSSRCCHRWVIVHSSGNNNWRISRSSYRSSWNDWNCMSWSSGYWPRSSLCSNSNVNNWSS